MSYWYEITGKEDVDLSDDETEVHILFKSDREGNHYVSVPVEILQDLIAPEVI